MNIRQSVFGEIAVRTGNGVSGIDLETLLHRLILFDTVVIKSVGLHEVPLLVRAFGKSGFLQLLSSGLLKISCEATGVITGLARDGVPTVPPSHFTFGMYELGSREDYLRKGLRPLQGIPGLKTLERQQIEEAIIIGLVRPGSDYKTQLQAQVESDIRNNSPALRVALERLLAREFGEPVQPLEIRVEETEARIFHIITDLSKVYGLTEQRTHDILHSGVSAIANLNHRVADMAAYSSVTGFTDAEAPLLFGKFAGIIAPQNPEPIERQFGRVVDIANIPPFAPYSKVNVEKLLTLRESPECLEFRSWLIKLDGSSDEQIAEMIGGVRNKLGSMLQSGPGKVLRFAATFAVGVIPPAGPIAGAVAGAVDTFLLDKIFPTSGVVAFLTKSYPSLYKRA